MIWLLLFWFVVSNSYFGWNALPKSDAELVADGVGVVLVALWYLEMRWSR